MDTGLLPNFFFRSMEIWKQFFFFLFILSFCSKTLLRRFFKLPSFKSSSLFCFSSQRYFHFKLQSWWRHWSEKSLGQFFSAKPDFILMVEFLFFFDFFFFFSSDFLNRHGSRLKEFQHFLFRFFYCTFHSNSHIIVICNGLIIKINNWFVRL